MVSTAGIIGAAIIASITFIVKDTLVNLFAGIRLKTSSREINEGDKIIIYRWPITPQQPQSGDAQPAEVKNIFWRRTILEYQGREIIIQNVTLIENPVEKF